MLTPLPQPFIDWCAGLASDVALELVTCGADGWPHVAHLSVGEVVVDAVGGIRLALWRASRGVENLLAGGKGCLLLTIPEGVFEIRALVLAQGGLPDFPALHAFHLQPVAVRDKSAPYATILSGTRFALNDPAEAHTRWAGVREKLLAGLCT